MRRVLPAALVLALVALAGCSTGPATDLDIAAFATGLGAAVATENERAYGSESYVTGVAAGHTASGDADVETRTTDAAMRSSANAFTASLSGAAASSWADHADSLASEADALGADSPLSRIAVSVESATVTASTAEETTVDTELYIVRSMNSGIDWEEVVPYTATIDNVTGKTTHLVIHTNP